MSEKRVRNIDVIELDEHVPPLRLEKGGEFIVEDVVENYIILRSEDGPSFMVDLPTFEVGFEAVSG